MTPEETAAAVGQPVVPKLGNVDLHSVKPFCFECGTWVDLRKIREGLSFVVNGKRHLVVLCNPCLDSLDAASHAETLRRLYAMQARVAS